MKINFLAFFVSAILALQASSAILTPYNPSSVFTVEVTPTPKVFVDTNLRTDHKYPEFSLMTAFENAVHNPVLSPRRALASILIPNHHVTTENVPGSPLILIPSMAADFNSPKAIRVLNPLTIQEHNSPSPKAPLEKKSISRNSETRQASASRRNKFDFKRILLKVMGCFNSYSSPQVVNKRGASKGGKAVHITPYKSKLKID